MAELEACPLAEPKVGGLNPSVDTKFLTGNFLECGCSEFQWSITKDFDPTYVSLEIESFEVVIKFNC